MWFAPLLKWLAVFFAWPVLDDLLKGYQAKLAAGNTSERIAADLAARELAAWRGELADILLAIARDSCAQASRARDSRILACF